MELKKTKNSEINLKTKNNSEVLTFPGLKLTIKAL